MSGETIRKYRRKKGISQKELAGLLGINPRTVTRWEHDETQPGPDEIKELCEILGIPETIKFSNEENDSTVSETVLDRISDSVDNLVTGQDTINRTIESGQVEFRKHQEELIKELHDQNTELLNKLEAGKKEYSFQKELLRQKKIRNAILIVFALIIISLVAVFLWILAAYGTDPNDIKADEPALYITDQ